MTSKKYTLETWCKVLKEFEKTPYLYGVSQQAPYRFEDAYLDQIIFSRLTK